MRRINSLPLFWDVPAIPQRVIGWIVMLTLAMPLGGFGRGPVTAEGAIQTANILNDEVPLFQVDVAWPKQLPNQWILGNVAGLHVDGKDHVWIIHRPLSGNPADDYAQLDPPAAECCRLAPSIIEFDAAGTVLQAFGGPDKNNPTGKHHADGYEWPREHGLFVDYKGNIWTGADEKGGATVTKLTHTGKLIFQKGKFGKSKGNADTTNFGQPTSIYVDPKTKEAFIADGYQNNRVIVLDAETGAFKRMWGAYGNQPVDGDSEYDPAAPPSKQFRHPVHCVELSRDDLVYVCDRRGNRVQVFHKDGTFVKEGFVAPWTRGFGAVHDIAFSADPQQRFLYVGDGANKKVWILRRDDLNVVGSFGHGGHMAGQFSIVHALAADSKGNVYVGETMAGNRVQKFKFMGMKRNRR